MHREFELRDSRAKKWNIAGYEGAPALDGAAREGAKGRRERVRQGERSVLAVGGGGGKGDGDGGHRAGEKKPMRFRGRLIGSRTYTYSPSTNPTVRVLIFTPLPFVAFYQPCSTASLLSFTFADDLASRASDPATMSRASITKSGASLTHRKRICGRCS